jgi:7-carboxy-7-deazaguanine synthase
MAMNVMEIYRSVQGEGTLLGVPTTFVRFFACNLRCSWCDTKYSWSVREGGTWETLAAEQVAEQIAALGGRHVVLTGGEPTLQRDLPALAELLKQRGYHLTVETNATIFPEKVVPLIDLWSLSPKLGSAGENYVRHPILERFLDALRPNQQQWKFVVRDDADERQLRELLQRYPLFAERKLPIVLQPEGDAATPDYAGALEQLAERVRDPFWDDYFVRVLPQMHVIIWGRRRWV